MTGCAPEFSSGAGKVGLTVSRQLKIRRPSRLNGCSRKYQSLCRFVPEFYSELHRGCRPVRQNKTRLSNLSRHSPDKNSHQKSVWSLLNARKKKKDPDFSKKELCDTRFVSTNYFPIVLVLSTDCHAYSHSRHILHSVITQQYITSHPPWTLYGIQEYQSQKKCRRTNITLSHPSDDDCHTPKTSSVC